MSKSGKLPSKAEVAKVNKTDAVRNLRSGKNVAANGASKTLNPTDKPVSNKRKSAGGVAFDEMTEADSKLSKKMKKAQVARSEPKDRNATKESKSTKSPKLLTNCTSARLKEGTQIIQMAVDVQDDKMFQSTMDSSDGDSDDDSSRTMTSSDSDSDDLADSESEPEEGQIKESQGVDAQVPSSQEAQIEAIDQEMQRRIVDLHDKMEENGLERAVQLIEQLFDSTPGDDKKRKEKLKGKIKKKIERSGLGNSNDNSAVIFPMNIPLEGNQSEETPYRKAVQKRNSSSSEDGLDLSNETNMLNHLILGEVDKQDTPMDKLKQQTTAEQFQVRPSTSNHPGPDQGMIQEEITLEEHAANIIRLSKRAKASMFPPKGQFDPMPINNVTHSQVQQFNSVAQIDYDYLVIGAHVDDTTQEKIIKGQYVDFSKLLPRDKVLMEENGAHHT